VAAISQSARWNTAAGRRRTGTRRPWCRGGRREQVQGSCRRMRGLRRRQSVPRPCESAAPAREYGSTTNGRGAEEKTSYRVRSQRAYQTSRRLRRIVRELAATPGRSYGPYPHLLGPPPPQTWGGKHVPQLRALPHPSPTKPHSMPWSAQVSGEQERVTTEDVGPQPHGPGRPPTLQATIVSPQPSPTGPQEGGDCAHLRGTHVGPPSGPSAGPRHFPRMQRDVVPHPPQSSRPPHPSLADPHS
jgi:hypothetical protein